MKRRMVELYESKKISRGRFVAMAIFLLIIGGKTAGAGSALTDFPYQVVDIELQNANSGLCMDVAGADTSNGARVQQYACSADKNQSWFFAPALDAFQIRAGHVGGKNLTVSGDGLSTGAEIEIDDPWMAYSQVWKVKQNTDGTFEIRSYGSDKCLDIAGGSTGSNAHIVQNQCTGAKRQKWWLRPRTTALSLIAKHSGKCLDIAAQSTADNANVQQYQCLDQDNQRWYLQYADTKGTYFYLVSPNGEKCLDVADGSTQDGANVQQFTCNKGDNQKWQIVSQGDDYFTIQNKKSKKCLDIAGGDLSNNANLQQYKCTGGANQLFRWTFFQERHVQLVQLAEDNGTNRSTIPTLDMQTMVEYANELYRANGLRLLFDPNGDVANVNSSGLRLLGQGATIKCPDNNQMTDIGVCAQRYAASKWPEKIVVYVRGTEADPGNGFSGGGSAFIVLGLYRYKMVCGSGGDTGVPDKFWLAHELGHYLGLMHNQVNLDYVTGYTEASQLLKNANDNIQVFDADFLPDTPPGVHWDDCALPHDRVFNMTLAGKNGPVTFLVDNDNAMSYYYSENRRLTGNQSKLIRATAITRWY